MKYIFYDNAQGCRDDLDAIAIECWIQAGGQNDGTERSLKMAGK
jgi:hypothetical protein